MLFANIPFLIDSTNRKSSKNLPDFNSAFLLRKDHGNSHQRISTYTLAVVTLTNLFYSGLKHSLRIITVAGELKFNDPIGIWSGELEIASSIRIVFFHRYALMETRGGNEHGAVISANAFRDIGPIEVVNPRK